MDLGRCAKKTDDRNGAERCRIVETGSTHTEQGGSCAETTLLAVLRQLDLPEDRLHAAACFGGEGSGNAICAHPATGGFMALGNAAGACFAVRQADESRRRQDDTSILAMVQRARHRSTAAS